MRLACVVLALALAPLAAGATSQWETRAPMPLPRTEVAAATVGSEIMVLGGFTSDRGASKRVDAYSPSRNRWRRLPDLPVGVHHAMAVGAGGRLYVLGGYTVDGVPQRSVRRLEGNRWRSLPQMPFARAAAGAAVAGGRIVVAGGVTTGARRLTRNALSFDLRARRWSVVPGPTPREHLGAASLGGTVYAVAGRTSGLARTSCTSSPTGRETGAGSGCRPCRIRAAAPAQSVFSGRSSPSEARSREERSQRCLPTA